MTTNTIKMETIDFLGNDRVQITFLQDGREVLQTIRELSEIAGLGEIFCEFVKTGNYHLF